MKIKAKTFADVSICLISCLSSIIIFQGCSESSSADPFGQTKEIGNEIIVSIKAYHNDHNKYPEKLDDLVPHYIGIIPQPTWGTKQWVYRFSDKGFSLSVGLNEEMYNVLYYTSYNDYWSYNR